MKAVRVHAFGSLDAMVYEDVPRPSPGSGEVLVRVAAAGVGPWDAWVREGKSALPQPLPLTLGADLSGVVEAVGPEVAGFAPGEAVFGVTNRRFTGASAAFALAEAGMVAAKPAVLGDVEAASVPVVACTAYQMLSRHAAVSAGQSVLVLGGAGNVGAYAVQLARLCGARVAATARERDLDFLRSLGAAEAVATGEPPPHLAGQMDVVIDTVGGGALAQAFDWLRPGGVLVSAVAAPDQAVAARRGVRAQFILVDVTAADLRHLAGLFEARALRPHVGEVLGLSSATIAHRMLAEGKHRAGKIVLVP
ncbi:MAG: NADP-dependent oxidoreductase [Acetobacteraceae bacterium]|nr:NADP-dependent oxidoreductase [Acetobacteraceae bacterium]